jgi:hypothetical protein
MDQPLIHRYAATNVSIDRGVMRPNEIFKVGDRILVHGNLSPHQGRKAVIRAVGNRRLTVRFEDGLPGTFIDYKAAMLIPPRGFLNYDFDTQSFNSINWTGDPASIDRIRILRHFCTFGGMAIAQLFEDEEEMANLLDDFNLELRSAVGGYAVDNAERVGAANFDNGAIEESSEDENSVNPLNRSQ